MNQFDDPLWVSLAQAHEEYHREAMAILHLVSSNKRSEAASLANSSTSSLVETSLRTMNILRQLKKIKPTIPGDKSVKFKPAYIFLIPFLLCLVPRISLAMSSIECRSIGGDTREISVSSVLITNIGAQRADVVIETSSGQKSYPQSECKTELTPEKLYTCENNSFVFLISLDKSSMQAALNPYFFNGHQLGPFYFLCQSK